MKIQAGETIGGDKSGLDSLRDEGQGAICFGVMVGASVGRHLGLIEAACWGLFIQERVL
jgi:hypothetical protein